MTVFSPFYKSVFPKKQQEKVRAPSNKYNWPNRLAGEKKSKLSATVKLNTTDRQKRGLPRCKNL